MFFRGFSPQPGAYDEEYLASFVRTQRLLADAGIFTVLDFHQDQLAPAYNGRGFPDWFLRDDGLPNGRQPFPQGYFSNPALNRAYDNLWANVPGDGDAVGLQDRFAEGWRASRPSSPTSRASSATTSSTSPGPARPGRAARAPRAARQAASTRPRSPPSRTG